MIKVGILGAGFMGTTHARAFAKMPNVQVAVIVDTVKEKGEKLAAEIGCRFEIDPEVVFDDPTISLIDVTLPTPFHPQYAIRALQAG
ncbi:MAG: Gfo/Idh/MocA family oxidoreductase, partial [Chloroflexota bacterium]